MAFETILVETRGKVGLVTLNRPQALNALNSTLIAELNQALDGFEADRTIGCVVITGSEKAFAAGADVKEFAGQDHAHMVRDAARVMSSIDSLARIPKPVIAAVTGYALGGGCELALAADFRVSADDVKWGQPEILLGIIPGAGGTQRLPRLIGPARAKDLIFSGRMVDAAEALRIGLADRVVPAAEVYQTAVELVRPYTNGPALALRAAKMAIDGGLGMDMASGLAWESQLFAGLFATDDRIEGATAFVEKRAPKFTGH